MTEILPTSHLETHAQEMQDCIWNHYQVYDLLQFDLSYPRLDFLASCFKKGQAVLNIGVGNGYLEEKLNQRGIDIHALDPSQEALCRLKARIPLGDKGQVGHSQAIPFDSDYLDGVIMTEVLEHLTDDSLRQSLQQVHRVLKPRGLFIGTVPYKEDLNTNMVICPCCQNVFHRWGHYQTFDTGKMKSLLNMSGFQIIKIYPRTFPEWHRINPLLILKSIGRYILGRLGEPIVNPNLFFIAQKPH